MAGVNSCQSRFGLKRPGVNAFLLQQASRSSQTAGNLPENLNDKGSERRVVKFEQVGLGFKPECKTIVSMKHGFVLIDIKELFI